MSIGSAIGSAVGGVFGYLGQREANKQNYALAGAEHEFQLMMSNSAYQRATADMQAAGLNPMLAYSQGGASTGHSTPPVMQNEMASAGQAAALAAGIDKTHAETENVEADTELKKSHSMESGLRSGHLIEELKKWEDVLYRIKHEGLQSRERTAQMIIDTLRQSDFWKRGFPDVDAVVQHLRKLTAEAKLAELEIPRAVNEAMAEETSFKRYVSPFLRDVGSITGAGASSAFGIRALRGKPLLGGEVPTRRVEHIHRRRP